MLWNPDSQNDIFDSNLVEFDNTNNLYKLKNTKLWDDCICYYPFSSEEEKYKDIKNNFNLSYYGQEPTIDNEETVNNQVQSVVNNSGGGALYIPNNLYQNGQILKSTIAFNVKLENPIPAQIICQINEQDSFGHYIQFQNDRFYFGCYINNKSAKTTYFTPSTGWQHIISVIEFIPNGVNYDLYMKIYLNGVLRHGGLISENVTPSYFNTTRANVIFDKSNLGSNNFTSKLNNFYHSNEAITDEEALLLYQSSGVVHKKPKTASIIPFNDLINDDNLECVLSMSPNENGSGSISYRQIIDDDLNGYYFNSLEWTNDTNLQNSLETVNNHLTNLVPLNKRWKPKIFLHSNGYEDPQIGQITFTVKLNQAPSVSAGLNKPLSGDLKVGESINLFSDATISNDVKRLVYKVNGGYEVEIFKGDFSTFQEALRSYIFNTSNLPGGIHNIILTAYDDFNENVSSSHSITLTLIDGTPQKIDTLINTVNSLQELILADEEVTSNGVLSLKNQEGEEIAIFDLVKGTLFSHSEAIISKKRRS